RDLRTASGVTAGRAVQADEAAPPPPPPVVWPPRPTHRRPVVRPRPPLFFSRSLFTPVSCVRAATVCLCFFFFFSHARWRVVSDTSRPPNSWRHRKYVGALIPCRRQRSLTLVPASASFRMRMICSSVNLPLFIAVLLDSMGGLSRQVGQFSGITSVPLILST